MNRTLVVSIDALFTRDIPVLQKLPNIGRMMQHASYAADMMCVYPTLTYPCHVSIATGCYPDRHGINNNEMFQPCAAQRADWFWFRRDIKVPTLLDHAKAHGLTTAVVTWPVMGGESADYTIGEIWAPREEDDPTPWFEQANSASVRDIFEQNKAMLRWMKTPQMDEFAAICAADIIHAHNPDLMLLHLSYLDHQRHRHGIYSPQLEQAFAFVDQQLGIVLDALEETGALSQTNFVILGDHGQLPCDNLFHINSLFRDLGWLTVENGVVKDYDVYAAQCAFSAQIHLKPHMDKAEVYRRLQQLQQTYPQVFGEILTKEEASKLHLTGEFDFVVEAGDRVAFSKMAAEQTYLVPVAELKEYKLSNATHGHLPWKGDKPPFIVSGPDALQDAVIHGGRLVDETPTILKMLGIEPVDMDGTPLKLFRP